MYNTILFGVKADIIIMQVKCLRPADNNTSTTVLRSFLRAASQYDVPSRVRCDHRGENSLLVGMFVLRYRDCNRGSILTGRSVTYRQTMRVDVFTGCVSIYIANRFTTVICLLLKTNGICLACTLFFYLD